MRHTFEIIPSAYLGEGPAIKCLVCGLTSYHPGDVRERYCACCHESHLVLEQLTPEQLEPYRANSWKNQPIGVPK